MVFDNFVVRFLRIKLFENSFTYIDFWSVVHFLVGGLFFYFGVNLFYTVLALVAFEFWEQSKYNNLFRKEKLKDTITDVVLGVSGWLIFRWWLL